MLTEKVKEFIGNFFSAIQLARIYPSQHPKLEEGLDRAYTVLDELFHERDEIVIGFINDELVFEKEIFFDLSRRFKDMTAEMKSHGIEKIVFSRPLPMSEFSRFISVLAFREEGALQNAMEKAEIEHVSFGKVGPEGRPFRVDKKEQEKFLDSISESFAGMLSGGQVDMIKLSLSMEDFYEKMAKGNMTFVGADLLRSHDLSTFLHSINVSLLAMFFSSRLGYRKEDIMKTGVAALLHDVGKIAISRTILKKPGGLTSEEFSLVQSHAHLGTKILFRYIENTGLLPLIVAYEHHINYDKSGYPRQEYPVEPNIISRIVTICDFYDALRSRRIYKQQYSPELIYEIMEKEKGKKFDPALLERFFQEMGVYPPGTVVELSDGRIAEVTEPNRGSIFRPVVRIIGKEQEKKETVNLEKNLDIAIVGTKGEA